MTTRVFLVNRETKKTEFELLEWRPEFNMALLRERTGDEYWTTLQLRKPWVREKYKLKEITDA